MTTLNILDQAKPFSDLNIQFGIGPDEELSFTVPGTSADYFVCEFSWDRNFSIWVGFNIDPNVPSSGSIVQKNRIEQNPLYKFVRGGDVLNFISDQDVVDANVNFYILNSNKFFPASSTPVDQGFWIDNFGDFMITDTGKFIIFGGSVPPVSTEFWVDSLDDYMVDSDGDYLIFGD